MARRRAPRTLTLSLTLPLTPTPTPTLSLSLTLTRHADGPHMPGGDPSFVAPLHAVNVFVPLVDLTPANGPTEFTPGSHFDFDVEAASCTLT